MRRTIFFSLFVLLALSAANYANAQRRGGGGFGAARGGRSHGRIVSPYGFGYADLPYDYDFGTADGYAPQPVPPVEPPPQCFQPPPVAPPGHSVITEYNWPAEGAVSSRSEPETQPFAIVLKDGATLSAVAIFTSDDGVHYVDPEERHLRLSMSEVDREATLKLNRARNLNLHLPAPQ